MAKIQIVLFILFQDFSHLHHLFVLYINYNQNLLFEHKGEKVTPDYWPYYMNDTIKNGATATGIDFSFQGKDTRISGFAEADNSINFEGIVN